MRCRQVTGGALGSKSGEMPRMSDKCSVHKVLLGLSFLGLCMAQTPEGVSARHAAF